jgi:hypothetical protein
MTIHSGWAPNRQMSGLIISGMKGLSRPRFEFAATILLANPSYEATTRR